MSKAVKRIPIKATHQLRSLMRAYFTDLDAASASSSRRVAWCTSVGPCEILTALGFDVYFPENHGALLGARKVSKDYIPRAVAAGYAAESCSYMTSDIGAALANESPLRDTFGIAGPPMPDLLVYNTNQCREVQDWWRFFGERHGAHVLGVCPPTHVGAVTGSDIAFVKGRLETIIGEIETRFDVQMNRDLLREVVARSSRASHLWREVLDTARHCPSPLTFWDGVIHMAPVILMRGSQAAIDYYELLLREMEQRVANGVAAVTGERFRLYWEGMPIWPMVRELSEKFFDLRAAIVASTYCNSWAFEPYDGGDPLEWMAKTSLEIFINRDEPTKEAFLLEMFDRFGIDGAIFHNARTCPNNTNSRFGMAQRLRGDAWGKPVLVLDGDLSDARFVSGAQMMTNIEAFMEQLAEYAPAASAIGDKPLGDKSLGTKSLGAKEATS